MSLPAGQHSAHSSSAFEECVGSYTRCSPREDHGRQRPEVDLESSPDSTGTRHEIGRLVGHLITHKSPNRRPAWLTIISDADGKSTVARSGDESKHGWQAQKSHESQGGQTVSGNSVPAMLSPALLARLRGGSNPEGSQSLQNGRRDGIQRSLALSAVPTLLPMLSNASDLSLPSLDLGAGSHQAPHHSLVASILAETTHATSILIDRSRSHSHSRTRLHLHVQVIHRCMEKDGSHLQTLIDSR